LIRILLIRPSQAESTKGKNVIIGEKRPEKKTLQNRAFPSYNKGFNTRGHGKGKKTDSQLTGQTSSLSGLTGPQGGLTDAQTVLIGMSNKSGNSSKEENKARPSFKKLSAKYEKEGAIQKQKGRPDEAKYAKSTSTSSEQSDPCVHQGNLLCQIQGQLLQDFVRILVITHLQIIVECICGLITFNILLCIQVVYHQGQLLLVTIW